MKKKYSVIIPAYNIEFYVSNILSFINDVIESRDDVEFIIVNDGSTDKTKELLTQTNSFIYLEQSNNGVSSARNLGIEHAKGEYILFLDADDDFSKHLFLTLDECNNDNFNIVIFNYKINNVIVNTDFENGDYSGRYILYLFLKRKINISFCCFCYKRFFLLENNIFFKNGYPLGEDIHFMIRVLHYCDTLYYIKDCLFFYNLNANSSVNSKITGQKIKVLDLYDELNNLFVDDVFLNSRYSYFKLMTFMYLLKKTLLYSIDNKESIDFLFEKRKEFKKLSFSNLEKLKAFNVFVFIKLSFFIILFIKVKFKIYELR
ncbi:glycosyltransferase family 2 protein [Candidatus Symbiopectobacterium sp. NZEC127]|uniref:glycosyltransferase family 2 protein n=1 Tax=Candidatus Symbiopectobacterium sp. NZEC127 TaxID=2820472 RepID=UPI00222679A1|nr:glycosyltransferase family A protein [Candidatus Symbiopectobacterium sp. NZEC127]MCW2488638.1 glycosyltransferase family 2 protein [Candidatus Symbiopectobacterium sp. NZEC127]